MATGYYGLIRRLRRGVRLSISPLYKCNYDCFYCTLKLPTGKRQVAKIQSLAFWKHFIDNFPSKLQEVYVVGGEPTLLPYFDELVNYLLVDKKQCVTVYTNLSLIKKFDNIKPTPKLRIQSTYHHLEAEEDQFKDNYQVLKKRGFDIDVDEIDVKLLSESLCKDMLNANDMKKYFVKNRFYADPQGRMHLNCYYMFGGKFE